MKKRDMKKLALMGLASGLLISGQASAEVLSSGESKGVQVARGGCGSRCSGTRSGQVADNSEDFQNSDYNNNGNQSGSGPNYYQQGPSHHCGGQRTPRPYSYETQGQSHSCSGQRSPNYPSADNSDYNQGGSHSCSGQNPPGQYRRNDRSYSADNFQSTTSTSTAQNSNTRLNETQLINQLNDQGKATYNSLDSSGKALALKLANASCKGKNECKGLNSCKTENNSCAGQGSCQGKSNCKFKDKNVAVKVAAMKMAEKRGTLNKTNSRTQF